MEEMVIWEQYTVTLNKDPRKGFGIAISGGRDRPSTVDGDTSIIISDVVSGGPADGRLQTRDKIAMVNGLSMESVSSSFAIHTLKTCGKLANITVKRPRKIHLPVTKSSQPKAAPVPSPSTRSTNTRRYDSDEEYSNQGDSVPQSTGRPPGYGRRRAEANHNRGYDGDSSSERSSGRYRDEDSAPRRQPVRSRRRSQDGTHCRRSQDSGSDRQPFTNGYSGSGLALMSGFKRLPRQDVPMKPIRSVLVKSKDSEEYGLKLGSQIFIKHITDTGLAAQDASLQEGDLILKINGVASENMSLAETRQLIEHSEGRLTLLVLRDNSQFLVNIPQVRDSDSESSHLDDISDLGSDVLPPPPPAGSPPYSPEPSERTSPPSRRHSSKDQLPAEELTAAQDLGAMETSVNNFDAHPEIFVSKGGGEDRYSPDSKVVHFVKAKSIGLRLAGGNDVGIFVAGVQEGSPAELQGIREGDQILQVNERVFHSLTREEAVQYLLELMPGEEVVMHVQNKQDSYRKMVKSNGGDSFYIRTHFDFEKDTPSGLSFTRGEVFHVVDTLYRGKMGSWLAMRMGKDLQEMEKGIIPNRSRADQIASLESVLKATPGSSGPRAEFWKLRGLRGAKKTLRKSREDLSALTKQGHYPPYERVVLQEATFKRPVVVLGPIADIAMQKLITEMPDQFEIAESVPREGGGSAKVIKLNSVWEIAQREKHALLDITPVAVERLNYMQYFPIVVFCEPDSRQGIKAMRQWLAPDSKKSSRRLYAQALKMQKHCAHLFAATISLAGSSNSWYQSLKDIIHALQSQPVWMAEEQLDIPAQESLDVLSQTLAGSTGYLTCDSRANSDYDETDAEGEAYTDQDLEEAYREPALGRSSEPTERSPEQELSERVEAALSYPIEQRDGDHQPQGQWRQNYTATQDYDIREYEHEALRKKFTQARAYDSESDQDYGYDWGPATDL
ncbi:tight junction protein ZO-3 [Hemicordylus capensis]|uniref:tight junction protein ZO-3 n=1 Tax=Hemicordylus capensis TaxID=884348 RepID=UPI0023025130|nr:tight junction protein ZO-3 [Hemicordylus capensis]XP_053160081.1 tight junction protein ZO-3 [Hemicordylus capensis]XP_053160082.1 tight junction protein ZO-3 [Hemicordylus capensis]